MIPPLKNPGYALRLHDKYDGYRGAFYAGYGRFSNSCRYGVCLTKVRVINHKVNKVN